jgi:hypothetical protein
MAMITADQFLLELYKEEQTHARHTEVQRLEVTKFILVAVGVLIGFMATLKLSIYCLPFEVLILALGFIGLTVTSTYVTRFDDNRKRARAFRSEIDQFVVPAGKAELVLSGNRLDKTERLRSFWERINRGVIVLGAICLLCNLLAVGARINVDHHPISFRDKIINQLFL